MLFINNLFVSFVLLTFAAVAWVLIRYPAEKELKTWHAQHEENRKFERISTLDFYRTSPPSRPTRKSSVGFFISITLLICSLLSACEVIFNCNTEDKGRVKNGRHSYAGFCHLARR